MLSHLWKSTTWTSYLFYRTGYAFCLVVMGLWEWLRLFPLVDKWLFTWIAPRAGLVLLGSLITPLPIVVLVLLMFIPPGLFAGVVFLSFMGALTRF